MNPIQTIRTLFHGLDMDNGLTEGDDTRALDIYKALAELEKQEPVLAMREPSLGGILFAVEQAVKNGCCPFEIEVAFDAYAAECQAELATQRRYASVHEHPPCKGISCGITSSAQKHSPECLAEAAFHQGWSDHDGLDLHVYASLVKKYTAPAAQQPQARTDFTDEWTGYLKDGETPFERFLRERKDLDALTKLYQRALEENERLKAQQPQAEPDWVNGVPHWSPALIAKVKQMTAELDGPKQPQAEAVLTGIMYLADSYARDYASRDIPTGELYRSVAESNAARARLALVNAIEQAMLAASQKGQP